MRDSLREWSCNMYVNCGGMRCYFWVTCSCRRCIHNNKHAIPRRGISIVCLLYNTEFLDNSLAIVLNPNEIHSLGQTRYINLLGFFGNVARK